MLAVSLPVCLPIGLSVCLCLSLSVKPMSLESRLALEPLQVDLPMMTSSLAGQEQDDWLRDGCLSVIQVVAS